MKKSCCLIFILLMIGFVKIQSQFIEIYDKNLHTVRVLLDGQWEKAPILELGKHNKLNISFDDLSNEYKRYSYRVEQCNFDWSVNKNLFYSEYLKRGSGKETIDNYEESVNTTVPYTHYSLNFPNSEVDVCVSGNYRIVIYDEEEEKDVLVIPFYVIENIIPISAQVTTNTEIDWNSTHQQVTFQVNTESFQINYPETEIKTVVLKNNMWYDAVINPKPDYITDKTIEWRHTPELIFNAGNEYRKFEMTTLRHGMMNIDNIRWFSPYYHATIFEDKARKNYIYDEEHDGAFYINNIDYSDVDLQSDYVFVHFSLNHEPIDNGDVYINGGLTYNKLSPEYIMSFNSESNKYEGYIMLKQGYYEYQYLYVPYNHNKGKTALIEGDYYQTENKYTILVYYSQKGSRYDRLIGYRDFKFYLNK